MEFRHTILAFDAADLGAESAFWAALFDGRVDADDDWHTVLVDDEPRMAVQLAPDHVRPTWPAIDVPQQMHLDLYVEDIEAGHAEVLRLGATELTPGKDRSAAHGFLVYADPAGHPFCLCWG